MPKITLAVLTFAAFLYAAWLVILRRQLPDPNCSKGLRRRFILATLLFVGLFGVTSAKGDEQKPKVMCYDIMLPTKVDLPIRRQQVAVTLKAVWRTLDPNRAEEFRNKLQEAVGQSVIRRKTADMLAIAFSELSYHKQRKLATCYIAMPFIFTVRENAQQQLELLENARKSGKINEKTAKKAQAVLAREVEMLYQAKGLERPKDRTAQERLIEEYKTDKLTPGDSASVASGIIIEMEEGQAFALTPAKRLALMKERIEKLLTDRDNTDGCPVRNDWMDPGIQPNISELFEKAGLITNRIMVECYKRMAGPVKARSEELKKLQEELLDKNVKAGVLDVEVAEKAAVATTQEPDVDYATEADIRDYQRKVRRVVRLLYKHGELPSSFVKKIEKAADIEIISFDSTKALRNDVRWHLRSLFWEPVGDEVLKTLEKRKLIPSGCNHRLIMEWFGNNKPDLSDDAKKQLAEFETLLESKDDISFPEDKKGKIEDWQILQADTEYRLKIRRICRALIKTGLVDKDSFKAIEDSIEIPIFGVLEKR